MPTVLRNGRIYSPAGADLSAMVVVDGMIAWLGTDDGVSGHLDGADDVIDLQDALVTPAFVDAHVHVTDTGLLRAGLDLVGTRSRTDLLDRLSRHARIHPGAVIFGSGWDDSGWADPALPTAADLDAASGGRPVYLSRVDGHCALVGGPLATGGVSLRTGPAHDTARAAALARLTDADRAAAQRAGLEHAAARGIGCVHEMAGPAICGADDLAALLALATGPHAPGVEVIGYWGELGGIETARALGAVGAGGDLFCDGSLGSHTAALTAPYADLPDDHADRRPTPRLSAAEVAEHVIDCTAAGLQAGFHAIGDAAVDAVLAGVEAAADRYGPAVRTAGHRVEHAEMVSDPRRFAAAGLTASVQPAFDAAWGGPSGMYSRRLGGERAAALNDLNALATAGAVLAFGSDSPVTPLDPWGAIRAAAYHHSPGSSISVRAAFNAHTRGGWRAARREGDGSGVLAVGSPATFAVWASGDLVIDVPDERVARWSTDPRAAVAGLPDVAPGQPLPVCGRTVVRGRTVYAAG